MVTGATLPTDWKATGRLSRFVTSLLLLLLLLLLQVYDSSNGWIFFTGPERKDG